MSFFLRSLFCSMHVYKRVGLHENGYNLQTKDLKNKNDVRILGRETSVATGWSDRWSDCRSENA